VLLTGLMRLGLVWFGLVWSGLDGVLEILEIMQIP